MACHAHTNHIVNIDCKSGVLEKVLETIKASDIIPLFLFIIIVYVIILTNVSKPYCYHNI